MEKIEYHILRNDNEPATTGEVYPQISQHKNWLWLNSRFLAGLPYDVLPETNYILDSFCLDKKAKLTDFLTDKTLHWGFIMSNHVKQIFESFQLPPHKFFKAIVEAGDTVFNNYNWFFPAGNIQGLIDFRKSIFQISHRFLPKEIVTSGATFKDFSDIKRFENHNSHLRVHGQSIYFIEKIKYDIFLIGGFSFDWIISDRLKTHLEKSRISGFVTKKINWIK